MNEDRISFRPDEGDKAKLERLAKKMGTTPSDVLRGALRLVLKRAEGREIKKRRRK